MLKQVEGMLRAAEEVHHHEALADARLRGDRSDEAEILYGRGRALQDRRDLARAEACYQQARDLAREAGNATLAARAVARLGEIQHRAGHHEPAQRAYEGCLPDLEAAGEETRALRAEVLNNLGAVHQCAGRMTQAAECYRASLALRSAGGDRRGQSVTLNNLGVIAALGKDWVAAEESFRQGLLLQRQVGDRLGEGQTLQNLALLHDARGDRSAALALQRQALAVLAEVGNDRSRRQAEMLLARWEGAC
jgi:tetratricopeptide (TPR) repeat protein